MTAWPTEAAINALIARVMGLIGPELLKVMEANKLNNRDGYCALIVALLRISLGMTIQVNDVPIEILMKYIEKLYTEIKMQSTAKQSMDARRLLSPCTPTTTN